MKPQLFGRVSLRVTPSLKGTKEQPSQLCILADQWLRIVATGKEAQAFILDLYDSDQLEFHGLQAWFIKYTQSL